MVVVAGTVLVEVVDEDGWEVVVEVAGVLVEVLLVVLVVVLDPVDGVLVVEVDG